MHVQQFSRVSMMRDVVLSATRPPLQVNTFTMDLKLEQRAACITFCFRRETLNVEPLKTLYEHNLQKRPKNWAHCSSGSPDCPDSCTFCSLNATQKTLCMACRFIAVGLLKHSKDLCCRFSKFDTESDVSLLCKIKKPVLNMATGHHTACWLYYILYNFRK